MNIERQIEFDKVKDIWTDLAVTDWAKEKIRAAGLFFSEIELKKQLRDTTDARVMIEKLGTPPLQNISEIKDVLLIAGKGDCLTPYQLERVERVLVVIKRLKDYLARGKMYQNSLAYYDENLDAISELVQEICNKIRNGAVDDYASKELEQIRKQIQKKEEQMKQKAEQILRSNKEYMADNYCTFRNGRICLPVKKDYKLKISGSVIDKSSTGSTLFIEPSSVAKYYEELQVLKISEENEVYSILYTLSAFVLASAPVLNANLEMIEKLDFIFSKGKLSIDMEGTEPTINTERRIKLIEARHPLMDKNIAVPLQFEVGETIRGIVITGPNTGGKTVAIKTVMLNCIMAQCGLHVTCEQADICMNSSYLCDIGDGQNLSENLSTFSAHIMNVLEVLNEANKDSFVIMDELGSGTDPTEGMGIAIAILEELRKSGAIFLVTTHYPEVKEYAAKAEDIVNARMAFDKETLRPTYQMVIGEAGESCAFYIADRLGMPGEMLKVAIRAAYGEEAVNAYSFQNPESNLLKKSTAKIAKAKTARNNAELSTKYKIGDSVMVYPEKKIGIVCVPINEKGVLRVQLPNKKIWINHKRVKLHVAATELYPEDYDFSIIFETVENRKKRHDMQRKYTDAVIESEEENMEERYMSNSHEVYIRRCYELAINAGKKGYDTFGAILVSEGKIIAEAENTADYEKGIFGHAEFNLVHKCANMFSDKTFENATFYTSCAPCVRCLMAIASLGIKTIVFGVSYTSFQQLLPFEEDIPNYEDILGQMNVSVKMIGPVLEDEGMHTFEYWGGEYRPLEELIREMDEIKKKSR